MKIRKFNVHPNLPKELRHLQDLAMNLWFCWNWEAVRLFLHLDPVLWEKSYQNPVEMLGRLPREKLEEAARDESFLANLERIYEKFSEYLSRTSWFGETYREHKNFQVAYFSCEYGIDEGLPVYSGGLGILSGDHLKSSSDLGIPLVGVGLLYQKGYFRQYLNTDGWQQERYPVNDWYNMPVTLERDGDGRPLTINVEIGEDQVIAQIWRVQVGRTPLYLLDTNIPENTGKHRDITDQLYGGDREMRIRQEILLGVGGVRALQTIGLEPTVYHINEGHSAFLALERIRNLMVSRGLSFSEAWEIVWATTVFTTHTPVPAGNEYFDADLVKKYFSGFAAELGLTWEEFMAFGQEQPGRSSRFCLTVLALNMAAFCNGVSELHGHVSRRMWAMLWPDLPESEVPITHITNGIHSRSWLSHDMGDLFERYLGPKFVKEPADQRVWERVDLIPDVELWRTHQRRKERLVFFARKRLKDQLRRREAGSKSIREADEVLNSRILTIGFARRFATYKRATLLFRDPDRLKRLLTNPERPVQIIIAGKAHPHDTPAKELIRTIVRFAKDPQLRNHIVFIEDYDINVARYFVQGIDVWLNTPLRPLEASGTSGMKVVVNGGLNVSVLDGWWCEGYAPDRGWAIGSGEIYDNPDEQDYVESEALYGILEREIVPLFYERDRNDVPRGWVAFMKSSMKKLGAEFNTHRMLVDYTTKTYLPAHLAGMRLRSDGATPAKVLSGWREKVVALWPQVSVTAEDIYLEEGVKAGETLPVRARVNLGDLKPDEVSVQVYFGNLTPQDWIERGEVLPMVFQETSDGHHVFAAEVPCRHTGRCGLAVRVLPSHPDLVHPYTPCLLAWE
jgi:starch phosphorylase